MKQAVERWDDDKNGSGGKSAASPPLPFPSHSDPAVVQLQHQWTTRTSEELQEMRAEMLLARAVCAVLKHGLRGVNVSCVLGPSSPLRGIARKVVY